MLLSENQITLLKKIIELELVQVTNEIRNETNLETKPTFMEVGGDGNSADEAAAHTVIDNKNALIELHIQKESDLIAALDRIESNTFGLCIDCGEGISFERATAYPTAKRCFRCQHLREMQSVNDVEPYL